MQLRGQQIKEILHDDAEGHPRKCEQGKKQTFQGVQPRSIAHDAPERLPRFHARTSSKPTESKWENRDWGSDARTSRGPYSRMRPSSRIRMSSARWMVARRCAMTMPVRLARTLLTARSMRRSVAGSRRDEASSKMTSPGSLRKTRAKANSCASPADKPWPSAPNTV